MKATKMLNEEVAPLAVSSLPTHPTAPTGLGGKGYTSRDMKEAFDKLPMLIIERFNALIDDISAEGDNSLAAEIATGLGESHTLYNLFCDIKNGSFATYLNVGEVSLAAKIAELETKIAAMEAKNE